MDQRGLVTGGPARRAAWVVGGLFVALLAGLSLWPLPAGLGAPNSPVLVFSDGSTASVALSPDEKWRIQASLDRVDPDYVSALTFLEDRRFRLHPGVDPAAVLRATVQNLGAGGVVSGASTLTMQLARMLEPRPRTLTSKLVEATRALQLELRLDKNTVLAAYLTRVPYGRNVEGIEAAALAYFGHDAGALSPVEICTLLAVPQNPNRRYPHPDNQQRLKATRDDIAKRLVEARFFTDLPDALGVITATPVPTRLLPPPRFAPHAAVWMRRQSGGAERVETTLDRGLQLRVEARLAQQHPELQRQGIHNAAVVVLDHRSGELRALVGNPDFWDKEHGGQIIGFDVPRSPGSTLKPLVYALAIDQGQALPSFLVADVPVRYGSYSPENYDGSWAGMVTLQDALARSLNIPFVNLLQKVGVERMLGLLRDGGVRSLSTVPGFYGLSAVVGGLELTPLELAGLYAALADGGRHRPLRWRRSGSGQAESRESRALFSEGSSFLTRKTLSLRERPDFPERRALDGRAPRISWKTGTSFGNRDAWAAGSGKSLTAVVWLGNFDRRSSPALVGADVAAPLLFDLLEGAHDSHREAEVTPDELVPVQLCRLSGRIPGRACPELTSAPARATRVPTETCPLHVEVELDEESGLAVGPPCRAGRSTRTAQLVAWPPSVTRYLSLHHASEPAVPAYAPDCVPQGAAPDLLSPREGETILLIPGLSADQQELGLEADAATPLTPLTWFINGELVGTAPARDRLWWVPRLGAHTLVVMDAAGRSASANFIVRPGLSGAR